MDDERLPEPQPSGALVPPPVHPPTALATAAPLPPRPRRNDDLMEARNALARAVERTLDALDSVGDSIATAVGLR
jgi:hypothetical protein